MKVVMISLFLLKRKLTVHYATSCTVHEFKAHIWNTMTLLYHFCWDPLKDQISWILNFIQNSIKKFCVLNDFQINGTSKETIIQLMRSFYCLQIYNKIKISHHDVSCMRNTKEQLSVQLCNLWYTNNKCIAL